MSTTWKSFLTMAACLAVLAGCEGETGPAGPTGPQGPAGPPGDPGPSLLLAYADVDVGASTVSILSEGPSGVTTTGVRNGSGDVSLTVTGTFPATQGTLLIASSSSVGVNNTWSFGEITAWSTTQIDLDVFTIDFNGNAVQDDFSFAVLGE